MPHDTFICSWMYADAAGQESAYAQVPGASSSASFQAVYWRCVVVFYAVARRLNPEARLVFLTNAARLPTVDGVAVGPFLERLGAETVRLGNTHLPPEGYYEGWRNQFYVFDAIEHLAGRAAPEDHVFLLDTDCLWVRPAGALSADLRRYGALTYDIGLPPGWPQNGLTRADLQRLYAEHSGAPAPALPAYLGGEIFAATGAATRRIAAEIPGLWEALLERHRRGLPHFNEEAHALGYLYHRLGYPEGTANPYIKRMWTALLHRQNVGEADFDLAIWHLPTEKRYGLRRLFGAVARPDSPFWSLPPGEPLARWMGRLLGVPRRTPQKLLADIGAALREKGTPGAIAGSLYRQLRHEAALIALRLRR